MNCPRVLGSHLVQQIFFQLSTLFRPLYARPALPALSMVRVLLTFANESDRERFSIHLVSQLRRGPEVSLPVGASHHAPDAAPDSTT